MKTQTKQKSRFRGFYTALFLSLLMISFNLFGNGLRDAFDPTLRGAE